LRDSFEQFRTITDLDLRRDIRIHFLDEISQDADGLICEWFSILIEELFDSEESTKEVTYTIDANARRYNTNHLDYYYFCGQVIAKALYEEMTIKAYLSKLILKMLLG
jgi:E3 ubiquitin-protein ligase HUWE1